MAHPPLDSRRRRSARQWRRTFGFVPAALTGLLVLLLPTAVPVVLDLRPSLLATALLAGLLLLPASRQAQPGRRRTAVLVVSVVCFVAASLAAYDLTLAYRTEEVSFTNGDVTLYGTLYQPRRGARHPAIVLMHGAGIEPRDEYRFYARAYARRGIAALAYDKRGSGASTGDVRSSTYQMVAADAVRAIEMLRQRADIDPARVGIWGVSEAEWTGVIAAKDAQVAFLVLVSASARSAAEQVAYETGALVRRAGFGEAAAREAAHVYRLQSRFERTGEGREELNERLRAAAAQPWFEAARYLETSVPDYDRVLELDWFPAWRARMDFDALPVLASLTCPVLVQNGGSDPKNEGETANERIRAALARGGNTRFTGYVYPNAEHNVIEWRLPFGCPPPFFARDYLETQLEWVRRQIGG